MLNVPADNPVIVDASQLPDDSGEGTGYRFGFDINGSVPIPGNGVLAAAGLMALVAGRRRRKH